MRKAIISFCFVFCSFFLFAGDIATFVNLGFSADGSKFAFGQYGLTDQTYRAYAEIYGVDVAENNFLPSGRFITSPTSETADKDSKNIFLSLLDRANPSLLKWKIKDKNEGRAIYAATDSTINETTLIFKDFETNDEYKVMLYKDKKSNLEASFYIEVEIIKPNGNKIKKTAGQKGKTRSGVRDYAIKKVIIDNTNTSLIFVIEKHQYDKLGNSIRYMVETIKL
nr:DUF2259 domain-containing protein [uncultured Treponema sp.]